MPAFFWMTPNSKWRLARPLKSIPQEVTHPIEAKENSFSLKCLGET